MQFVVSPYLSMSKRTMSDSDEPVSVRTGQEAARGVPERLHGTASQVAGGGENRPSGALGQRLDSVYLKARSSE